MIIKEATIRIASFIENLDSSGLAEGDAEKSESLLNGYLHITAEGDIFVTYTEASEGGKAVSEVRYSGQDGTVTVKRTGAIESVIVLGEGMVHSSLYKVPPYTFDMTVTTRKIRASLSEDGGTLDLHYNMRIGGADKAARMKIWISTNSNQT